MQGSTEAEMDATEFRRLMQAVQERAGKLQDASFDGKVYKRFETDCFKQAASELVPTEWQAIVRVAAQGWEYYSGDY